MGNTLSGPPKPAPERCLPRQGRRNPAPQQTKINLTRKLGLGGHDPGTLPLPPPGSAPQDPARAGGPASGIPAKTGRMDRQPDRRRGHGRGAGALLGRAARRERRHAMGAGQPARRLRRPRYRQLQHSRLRDRQRHDRAAPGHRHHLRPDRDGAHPGHTGERNHPGLHRHSSGRRGSPLPFRGGLRDRPRRRRSPWHLQRACRVRARGPAGAGRHLDRPRGRAGAPRPSPGRSSAATGWWSP